EVAMRMERVIRFDYGSIVPWVRRTNYGIVAVAGPDGLLLDADVECHGEDLRTVAHFSVRAGERKHFVLTWFHSATEPRSRIDPERVLVETESFWRKWASRSR